MIEFASNRLVIAAALCVIGAATAAQQPVFVDTPTLPLTMTAAKAAGGAPGPGEAAIRPAPFVMETSGHVEADGSVSTTCAAVPSATPHAVAASRPITKLEAR